MQIAAQPWVPNWVVPPGDTLAEIMVERGMTVAELEKLSGVAGSVLRGVLQGRVAVTAEIAKGLEDAVQVAAAFWLNSQKNYDEGLKSGKPVVTEPALIEMALGTGSGASEASRTVRERLGVGR